jgi:hypothetical protein
VICPFNEGVGWAGPRWARGCSGLISDWDVAFVVPTATTRPEQPGDSNCKETANGPRQTVRSTSSQGAWGGVTDRSASQGAPAAVGQMTLVRNEFEEVGGRLMLREAAT